MSAIDPGCTPDDVLAGAVCNVFGLDFGQGPNATSFFNGFGALSMASGYSTNEPTLDHCFPCRPIRVSAGACSSAQFCSEVLWSYDTNLSQSFCRIGSVC